MESRNKNENKLSFEDFTEIQKEELIVHVHELFAESGGFREWNGSYYAVSGESFSDDGISGIDVVLSYVSLPSDESSANYFPNYMFLKVFDEFLIVDLEIVDENFEKADYSVFLKFLFESKYLTRDELCTLNSGKNLDKKGIPTLFENCFSVFQIQRKIAADIGNGANGHYLLEGKDGLTCFLAVAKGSESVH